MSFREHAPDCGVGLSAQQKNMQLLYLLSSVVEVEDYHITVQLRMATTQNKATFHVGKENETTRGLQGDARNTGGVEGGTFKTVPTTRAHQSD